MTKKQKIKKAITLLNKARKAVEHAEELLGSYEGLTDDLGSVDGDLGDAVYTLESELDECDDDLD